MADHPDELMERVAEALTLTLAGSGDEHSTATDFHVRMGAEQILDAVRAWDDEQAARALYQPDRDDKDQEGAL